MLKIDVTLDIFSGRENPSWSLSEYQTNIFETKVQDLTFGDPPRESPNRLGYRGFTVSISNYWAGLPRELYVAESYITAQIGEEKRGSIDICGLEEWLITLAGEKGYSKIIEEGRKQ